MHLGSALNSYKYSGTPAYCHYGNTVIHCLVGNLVKYGAS